MICTIALTQTSNGKPAYFSSPDGITWNGTPEPYSAQLGDVVSIHNDPNYLGWDFNGGNVLLWDNNAWTLYYSVGIYGSIGQLYRGTSVAPPVYANDIKELQAGGKTWYLMALYIEEATFAQFRLLHSLIASQMTVSNLDRSTPCSEVRFRKIIS